MEESDDTPKNQLPSEMHNLYPSPMLSSSISVNSISPSLRCLLTPCFSLPQMHHSWGDSLLKTIEIILEAF